MDLRNPPTRANSRLSATPERSIIKLKPAFRPPKRKATSTRAASLGAEIAVSPLKGRRLKVRWRDEGSIVKDIRDENSTVKDISRDLELLEEVVNGLRRKVSPMEDASVEVRGRLNWEKRNEEDYKVVEVKKCTKPWAKALSNAPIHYEVNKRAAALYKPRFETSHPPVVKASKPRTSSRTARAFLRPI